MDEIERYLRSYLAAALVAYVGVWWLRSFRDRDVNLAYRQGRHDAIREWLTPAPVSVDQGDDESEG